MSVLTPEETTICRLCMANKPLSEIEDLEFPEQFLYCKDCYRKLTKMGWQPSFVVRRCITCKAVKPLSDFDHAGGRDRDYCTSCRDARFNERTYIIEAIMKPAHAAVHKALKDGSLVKEVCSVCGTAKDVEGHHRDYTKVLEVQWFCKSHHMEEHARMRKCGERVILPQDWRLQMVKPTERKIEGNRLAYTLREAASITGVPYHTLLRFLKSGDVRPIQGIRTRISKKELERFVETRGEYKMQARWLKQATKEAKA